MRVMSTSYDSSEVGEGRALVFNRREPEGEHTRITAQAVNDHVPYELALRAAALAEQLRTA
jgi:hypothetical protein